MTKSIYVKDEKLWADAQLLADISGISMSDAIVKLLEEWTQKHESDIEQARRLRSRTSRVG